MCLDHAHTYHHNHTMLQPQHQVKVSPKRRAMKLGIYTKRLQSTRLVLMPFGSLYSLSMCALNDIFKKKIDLVWLGA